MKKKLVIFLFVLGFMSISAGLGLQFIYDLKEDRDATLLRMEEIKIEYKNFSNSIDIFNDMRNSLYVEVFEDVYYDTMAFNDPAVKTTFSYYETSVNNVETAVTSLSKLCGKIQFPDNNINNKCSGYSSVYEQIVNAFVTDVSLYNNNISQYNNFQKENGSTNVLENYNTDKKYIDYNKDKKFEGKDE